MNKHPSRAQATLAQPNKVAEGLAAVRLRLACMLTMVCGALPACTTSNPLRSPALSAEARLQVAEAADASGDSDLAISMYSAAAAGNPDNVDLQLRCADALARAGKVMEARKLLEERLRTHPGQPDLTRALALIDLVAGRLSQAVAGLDQVLAANPEDARALVDKAVALDLQGQHGPAQTIYREVLANAPNDPVTRNNLALSLMLEGQTRQALDTLAPMQNVDSSPPRLKINLGILYAANGNAERSRELLGNSVSQAELAALTHALMSSNVEAKAGQ